MNREQIHKIIGSTSTSENKEGSALSAVIESIEIDVVVTVPYEVTEIFFVAKDKSGKTLVTDNFDFYGASEKDDFTESLLEIADIFKKPELRVTNNGKTVQAKGYEWYYWFGEFNN